MKSNHIHSFFPGFGDIIFVTAFLLALASGSQMLSIDSDLGRHLTLGNYILTNHTVPTRDIFSHTLTGQHRPPYEWLSQVLFALAHRLLGLDGVILLTATIIAVSFALLFRFAHRRSGTLVIPFLVCLLAMGASSIHWLARPHIFTFLFLVIWVETLEQLMEGKPVKLFFFPLIMLFWSNLHGGFVFGFLAWCAYFAGWLWQKWKRSADYQIGRKLLIVGLTSLGASFVTPDFWHNWGAVLNNRSAFILSRTVETMRPDLLSSPVLPYTILLVLTITVFLLNYRLLSASHVFLLTGLAMASLLMVRNIPIFAIACAPISARLMEMSLVQSKAWNRVEARFAQLGNQSHPLYIPVAATLVALIFFAQQYYKNEKTIFQFNPQVFPVQAVDWLVEQPQGGRMFNEVNWGGYILYRTWPQQMVFLDSQSDFYGEALMRKYEQIASAQEYPEALLEDYQVNWVIIPTGLPLAEELKAHGWQIIHQDSTAIILVAQ